MEFGIEKYAMLIMKSGKRLMTDGMKLPNREKSKRSEKKKTNQYWGILETDTIK